VTEFKSIDLYILAFSAITVLGTIWMGFLAARKSKTAHDFFVAGRSVSVGWNASAISGEYLSAASFMGIAGMVMSSGYDALWYPVCYACGYLFLLLFIAGPLRRFGAYTIPDFAEGRYDSPLFRKIAVVFVLFIGFFYTMPQMKGAGTTLAYIFPGLPYWAGVVLVGAVITLNVALGGMKGITLVQAVQYWAKMFAISVPIFVLMAVYGHYGKQLDLNSTSANTRPSVHEISAPHKVQNRTPDVNTLTNLAAQVLLNSLEGIDASGAPNAEQGASKAEILEWRASHTTDSKPLNHDLKNAGVDTLLTSYSVFAQKRVRYDSAVRTSSNTFTFDTKTVSKSSEVIEAYNRLLAHKGIFPLEINPVEVALLSKQSFDILSPSSQSGSFVASREPDSALLDRLKSAKIYAHDFTAKDHKRKIMIQSVKNLQYRRALRAMVGMEPRDCRNLLIGDSDSVLNTLSFFTGWKLVSADTWPRFQIKISPDPNYPLPNVVVPRGDAVVAILEGIEISGGRLLSLDNDRILLTPNDRFDQYVRVAHELGWINSTRKPLPEKAPQDATWISPFGPLTTKAAKAAKLSMEASKPYSLLYTYSLIIALVCGTAGLPHILVRFYTNPDGVAAKRTTMWVMILIGVFYLFPPVFGVLGRNLLPELYAGLGAKGTDKIVLELPRLLNAKYAPLGSVLSGITCAGAFAAFMSTFSGLLVSMTGALAHDVYGRMLRPQSTSDQRMRAFKVCAVVVGGIAILLGTQVESFQINFMVGQAFAIAAASYFPLLFMSAWWRGMTMKGAATGMLTGGLLALAGISLTSFTDLNWLPLQSFWATHPLLRILCEQPAIWAVPLAIALMVIISKLTSREVPADIRMKMLVLHAPEKLGLKQEYVQEHVPVPDRVQPNVAASP
jgi:Na+(H+)/acetate symporter ActP